MIKAVATHNKTGKPIIIFGLSEINLKKLKEGLPIKVELSELGLEGEIFIFYGATENKIIKDFKKAGINIDEFVDFRKLH